MTSPSGHDLDAMLQGIMAQVPHVRALGMRLLSCADGVATGEQPYDERLVGNPDTGVIAGGVVTTLLDSVCGMAVFSKLRELRRVATVDLRVDYLRPARPRRTLHCTAECYRVTRHIAFVRATVHDGDADDPLASASGTFALLDAVQPIATGEQAP